jgi:hypothetical protein
MITVSTGLHSPQQLRAAGGARCVAKSASGPIIARTIGAVGPRQASHSKRRSSHARRVSSRPAAALGRRCDELRDRARAVPFAQHDYGRNARSLPQTRRAESDRGRSRGPTPRASDGGRAATLRPTPDPLAYASADRAKPLSEKPHSQAMVAGRAHALPVDRRGSAR